MDKITGLHCTGCRACEQLCPTHSIKMEEDKEGFLQAVIHTNTCIDCGLCVKRCPQNRGDLQHSSVIAVKGARLKDEQTLYKTASGGAFAGMASYVINQGGVVFGVAYDDAFVARHIKAETIEELQPLLSSKYVQSDTAATYSQAKEMLEDGRFVLYSGTGCQIAGLKSFLGKREYPNLITIDLVCHGVTSPLLFAKYIEYLKEKHGANITEYDFRDKKGGWELGYKYRYKYRYKYKYKYKYGACELDPYYRTFLAGDAYRECCYECKYANTQRTGNITIADYWGVEMFHPEFYSHKGVSLVLLNSKKGYLFWQQVASRFYIKESKLEYAAVRNGNLKMPTRRTERRDNIYDGINEMPASDYVMSKLYASPSMRSRIKALLPMYVKLAIKTIKTKLNHKKMYQFTPPEIAIIKMRSVYAPVFVEPSNMCA